MAEFLCHGESFAIASRLLLVIPGDVESGVIRPGMRVWLTMPEGEPEFHAIHALEHVNASPPVPGVGLVFRLRSEEELERLAGLDLRGRILEVR